VCFQYPDRTLALDGVNLEVRAGEVHAVTGASGSGKTTLLNHVLGLLQPNEGKVSLCGTDTRRIPLPEIAKIVGGVLQNPDGQISEANVRDEIGSPLRYRQYERTGWFSKRRRYSDQYIDARIAEACDELGLALELLDQDPILLSSGLRKLVVTAETLAMDPAVLLLDEPTVGLGSSHRARLAGLLEKLREQGKAVLFADNDVDFIAENADQITVLHEGQVAFQGTVHQVFAEDHWDVLDELQIPVPRVARLARELGVEALRMDELIGKLA
jgi:energy-coupling factor transporter ATP-binding protein EcfA2